MDDRITLSEWLKTHSSQEEYQDLFYKIDKTMKYVHSQGYYITSFNPNAIQLENNSITFTQLYPCTNENYQDLTKQNITALSYVSIATYNNCLDFMNPSFIKDHFEVFTNLVPEEDIPYYRSVIVGNKDIYYSDYFEYRYRRNNAYDSSTSNTNQRVLSKSTAVGKAYSLPEVDLPNNNAAFVRSFLLPAIVIFITFIATILFYIVTVK